MTDRLVLGTAQLGMPYGINNRLGKPDFDRARDIVKAAFDNGISRFDTAQAYGDSEEVLGKAFDLLGLTSCVKVYSKLHPTLDLRDAALVRRSVDDSLKRLKVDHLEGLLLHREEGLDLWNGGLGSVAADLVKQGKINAFGVSFYAPEKAMIALDFEGVDLFQIPANIFDRRFEQSGFFSKGRDLKKSIFIRSVFLQGLLLMTPESVPPHMSSMGEYIQKFNAMAKDIDVSRLQLALGCVKHRYPDCFFVIGAESAEQIIGTTKAFQNAKKINLDESGFKKIPESVLNPSLWPKT